MIVVDASVLVTGLADDGKDGDRVRRRLRETQLLAPELLDIEVLSAWRRLAAAGYLDDRRVGFAIADLNALRVQRVPHQPLLNRCWELRHNLTAYDAAYVALAELFDIPLLTGDSRLANAPGVRCAVEII